MEDFTITTCLTTKDYTKAMFTGFYKKPVFILLSLFGLYLLITVFLNYLHIIDYYVETPFFEIIAGIIFVSAPALLVFAAVNQFKSNPNFQNEMIYTFDEKGFKIEVLTFKGEFTWEHITKQRQLSKFLILYHTGKFGNFIDKTKLNAEQMVFIKSKVKKK